ncbi:MAG: DUF2177 family protein [Filomicrobium sp.]
MSVLIAYVTILIVFGIIDAIWLTQMANALYRPVLGDMLVDNIRILPALAFYLMFPMGIVIFAVLPALRDGSIMNAFVLGALLGGLCFATYDLTNYATLKNWSLHITLIDIAYGAFVAGVCAASAYYAVEFFQGS